MYKYPELMCKYCIHDDSPIRNFEDRIAVSPYWSYIYATYFIFTFGLEKEDLSTKIFSSIKTKKELYEDIKMTIFLRDDAGYEPPEYPDPSLYGEKEIIKNINP